MGDVDHKCGGEWHADPEGRRCTLQCGREGREPHCLPRDCDTSGKELNG